MSREKLARIGIIVLLAAVLAAGARPAFRWWRNSRRDVWAAECRTARRDQRWDELRRLAGRWADRDPVSAEPWLFLAEAAQGLGDLPAVAEALGRVPETDSKVIAAIKELALVEFGPLNHPQRGEAACMRLLRIEPRATFAHQCLIQYYAATVQRAKLVRQIRFAIDEQRAPPEAYIFLFLLDTLQIGNGVEFNDHWLEAQPDEELFVVARAVQLLEPRERMALFPSDQRDGIRAEEVEKSKLEKSKLIGSLLEKFPSNLELLAYEIEVRRTRGEVDRVAELLARAPAAAEGDSRFWNFKGWVHEMLDESADAETAFAKALEINPLDWNARNKLAGCFRRRRDYREVERLTALVEEARELQSRMRSLPTAEQATPEILTGLSNYARKCGVDWLADAIDRAVGDRQTGVRGPDHSTAIDRGQSTGLFPRP